MNALVVVVVIIIVLVLVWQASICNQKMFEDAIEGVWSAISDEYCAAADIDAMVLTIGPAGSSNRWNPWASVTRPAHLVIMDNMHSGSFDLKYVPGSAWPFASKYTVVAEIIPSDLGIGDDPVWKGPVKITIDISRGQMVITDATDELVAVLSRDNATTAACLNIT
jgi:hypothetical protein